MLFITLFTLFAPPPPPPPYPLFQHKPQAQMFFLPPFPPPPPPPKTTLFVGCYRPHFTAHPEKDKTCLQASNYQESERYSL